MSRIFCSAPRSPPTIYAQRYERSIVEWTDEHQDLELYSSITYISWLLLFFLSDILLGKNIKHTL